jgi:hypothetical protein
LVVRSFTNKAGSSGLHAGKSAIGAGMRQAGDPGAMARRAGSLKEPASAAE